MAADAANDLAESAKDSAAATTAAAEEETAAAAEAADASTDAADDAKVCKVPHIMSRCDSMRRCTANISSANAWPGASATLLLLRGRGCGAPDDPAGSWCESGTSGGDCAGVCDIVGGGLFGVDESILSGVLNGVAEGLSDVVFGAVACVRDVYGGLNDVLCEVDGVGV